MKINKKTICKKCSGFGEIERENKIDNYFYLENCDSCNGNYFYNENGVPINQAEKYIVDNNNQ